MEQENLTDCIVRLRSGRTVFITLGHYQDGFLQGELQDGKQTWCKRSDVEEVVARNANLDHWLAAANKSQPHEVVTISEYGGNVSVSKFAGPFPSYEAAREAADRAMKKANRWDLDVRPVA